MGNGAGAAGMAAYDPLLQSINQPDTKVVLSLGGGGVRMFAHSVVFEFLEKLAVKDRISEVWGSSGGAIMALIFSLDVPTEEIKKITASAGKGGIVSHLPSYFSFAKNMFLDLFGRSKESASLKVFRNYQGQLQEFLTKVSEGRQPKKKLFCTAFNLDTEENEVLSNEAVHDLYGSDKVYQTDALTAVMASSAVPVLFEPVTIKDESGVRHYIDGALIEDVPTQSVYKKWIRDRELGLDKSRHLLLITVTLDPVAAATTGFLQNRRLRRLPGFEHFLMSLNCAEYVRKATTKAQKKLLQQDPNVELWDINIAVPNGGMLSLDLIPGVMEAAENCVPLEFRRIGESLIF